MHSKRRLLSLSLAPALVFALAACQPQPAEDEMAPPPDGMPAGETVPAGDPVDPAAPPATNDAFAPQPVDPTMEGDDMSQPPSMDPIDEQTPPEDPERPPTP